MKIFDKAQWQIDGGMKPESVVQHFVTVFVWLREHEMLSDEGLEELEDGIDDNASLNEHLVTDKGTVFLDECYDSYLNLIEAAGKYGRDAHGEELENIYQSYLGQSSD